MFLTRFLKLFVLVAVGLFSYEAAAGVSIENRELVYEGPISAKNNERAITLYEAAVDKPSTLVITSGGGNVDLGMDLGEFILEHDLDVKVNTFCFSSCANYVFTAGKNKWLGENAILGLAHKLVRELREEPSATSEFCNTRSGRASLPLRRGAPRRRGG